MHYKNGRPAQEGDPVIAKINNPNPRVIVGVLHSAYGTESTCNAQIAMLTPGTVSNFCITTAECYHAEDAFEAMEEIMATPENEVAEAPAPQNAN